MTAAPHSNALKGAARSEGVSNKRAEKHADSSESKSQIDRRASRKAQSIQPTRYRYSRKFQNGSRASETSRGKPRPSPFARSVHRTARTGSRSSFLPHTWGPETPHPSRPKYFTKTPSKETGPNRRGATLLLSSHPRQLHPKRQLAAAGVRPHHAEQVVRAVVAGAVPAGPRRPAASSAREVSEQLPTPDGTLRLGGLGRRIGVRGSSPTTLACIVDCCSYPWSPVMSPAKLFRRERGGG